MAAQKISAGVIVAITISGMMLTLSTAGMLSVNEALPTSGSISALNVAIYSDSSCSQKLMSIDWGTISPGKTVTVTFYIKNTGNTQVMLKMTKTNWNPPAANGPITLTWNREDTTLNVGQTVHAILTLYVSESISGIIDFSVDVVISGIDTG